MDISMRQQIQLAQRIQAQLRIRRSQRFVQAVSRMQGLLENLRQLAGMSQRLSLCAARGWDAAAGRTTSRIRQVFRDLPYQLPEIERGLDRCRATVPPLAEIIAEIQQLGREFDLVRCDLRAGLLAVTIGPIELEGVYLGEFEIQLHISALADEQRRYGYYTIVALDPHPAASNDAITHPHVSDEHLCEGDAGAAIHAALAEGRVCDFFQVVAAVLQSYNSASPYIALGEWRGQSCYDCGYSMVEDESYWCSECSNDFCSECISSCERCGRDVCAACLRTCRACGEPFCSACMESCPDCGRAICRTCRDEDQCTCHDQPHNQQESQNDPQEHQPAAQAVPIGEHQA